jgi:sugar phosphate isomerase/epimerase
MHIIFIYNFKNIGNNMKIGISSPAFALEPFSETLKRVAEHFSLWEIVGDLRQLLPAIRTEFVELTPSYDIEFSLHAPFNDLNIAALNYQLRQIALDYLKEAIIISEELGIKMISFHPGHLCPSGVYNLDLVKETNQNSIIELARFAEDRSVKLALENMPIKHWTLGNTASDILGLIKDTQLGICLDVGHANIMGDIDNFLAHIDKIFNVHIHDNLGKRDEHLVLGEGNIDIFSIVNKLATRYSGNLIIESNNLSEGILSRDYLKEILANSG